MRYLILTLIFSSLLLAIDCDYCQRLITGKYIVHENDKYHQNCYNKYIAPKCSVCEKSIIDKHIIHENNKYHEICYNKYIVPKCSVCKKSIVDKYIIHENSKYHERCYNNNIAPKCSVCRFPLLDIYSIDPWENQYHQEHEDYCNSCNRIISNNTSNGGLYISDNRIICGICNDTRVKSFKDIEHSREFVLDLLDSYGLKGIPDNVPIKIVNQKELCDLREKNKNCEQRGLTHYEYTYDVYSGKKVSKGDNAIYIIDYLPELEFRSVLAHEYIHVWLNINDLEYKSSIEEGFCNLGSALIFNTDSSIFSNIRLENMQNNPDPDYGLGYRRMNDCLEQYGWDILIKKMSNNDKLLCFNK